MDITLPEDIQRQVDTEFAVWDAGEKTARLWEKDAALWTNGDEGMWLDWLNIVEKELGRTHIYRDLHADIDSSGFKDVLLMGMGGSSLCPEVLAKTFGRSHFHILDSTVPAQVKSVEEKLDLEKTLFIVASKSGSTLEPNCFKQYFFDRLAQVVGKENAGRHFVAITDPGSKMESVAKEDGFRHIFYGEPRIGGRFSALSAFGLTAAAAMGLDVNDLLNSANKMVTACRQGRAANNPGVQLGVVLGICHKNGLDKLTVIASPEVQGVGAWLEQLIAESTGKNGVAIIPVDLEPRQPAATYSDDRVFVFLSVDGADREDTSYEELVERGFPVIRVRMNDVEALGQEFFRWEIATAVAGSVMGINPFDQPDVESAKIEARKITDEYEKTGALPREAPFLSEGRFSLFTDTGYAAKLTDGLIQPTVKDVLNAHLRQLSQNDYFALLAYIEMSGEAIESLTAIRKRVLEKYGNATCLGFGPRFLHSTGQAYKGGPNSGLFLQVTADDLEDLPVPGQKYTFSTVKAAQARGDFQVLIDRKRRALRIHLTGNVTDGLAEIAGIIE